MDGVFDEVIKALVSALLAGIMAAGTVALRRLERYLTDRERYTNLGRAAGIAPVVVRAAEQIGRARGIRGTDKFVTADNLFKSMVPDLTEGQRVALIEEAVFDLQRAADLDSMWTPLEDSGEAVHEEG